MTDDFHDDIRDERLRAAIKELPRDIPPERDLWPAIAARISARRHRPQRWLAAAAVAGLIAIGAIVAVVALRQPAPRTTVVAVPAVPGATPHLQARAEILTAAITNSTRLAPGTQAVLLENLHIIETSLANVQRALRQDPGNPALQGLLYQLYRDEVALLTAAQRVQLQTTTRIAL